MSTGRVYHRNAWMNYEDYRANRLMRQREREAYIRHGIRAIVALGLITLILGFLLHCGVR